MHVGRGGISDSTDCDISAAADVQLVSLFHFSTSSALLKRSQIHSHDTKLQTMRTSEPA